MGKGVRDNRFLVLMILCLPWDVPRAQCPIPDSEAEAAPIYAVDVDEVVVADWGTDRLRLDVTIILTATRNVSVRQVAFENLRLNDMPFYANPLGEHLRLLAGQALRLPRRVQLTVYYRDLDSLRPLQRLVAEDRVRIEGMVYLKIDLSPLAQIVHFARQAQVPLRFRQETPLRLPGGTATRAGLLSALATGATALEQVDAGIESALAWGSEWRGQLWRDYAPILLLAQVQFALRDRQGKVLQCQCTGVGFRISSEKFILSKALIEPWKFDPEIAAAIDRDRLHLDSGTYDVWVWSTDARLRSGTGQLDPSTGFRLSQGQIGLLRKPEDIWERVWVGQSGARPHKVKIHRRDTPANLALFEFVDPAGQMKALGAKFATEKKSSLWTRLAVFRFPGGTQSLLAHPDLVFLRAASEKSKIRLATPVDSSAWGAPLIAPEGIVGILQNENSGLIWGDALRILKLKNLPKSERPALSSRR